jgi:hypothetical protein
MVRALEASLYTAAPSFEEYSDTATLATRLDAIINGGGAGGTETGGGGATKSIFSYDGDTSWRAKSDLPHRQTIIKSIV